MDECYVCNKIPDSTDHYYSIGFLQYKGKNLVLCHSCDSKFSRKKYGIRYGRRKKYTAK